MVIVFASWLKCRVCVCVFTQANEARIFCERKEGSKEYGLVDQVITHKQ